MPGRSCRAIDLLHEKTGLSRQRLKRAMACGAVWLKRPGQGERRLRRATAEVGPGDVLECYYDAAILEREPEPARCVADENRYSVWAKPAGLLSQGSRYGDHCSLVRQAESYWQPPRPVFLVHRLDREAAGLVLLAHDSRAAAALSRLFQDQAISKHYRVAVSGAVPECGEIHASLDGKAACTRYVRERYDEATDTSFLDVTLITGRKHQIRRHFAGIGHAVLGDPRYGGRPCAEGLQLVAVSLEFVCPFGGGLRSYRLA